MRRCRIDALVIFLASFFASFCSEPGDVGAGVFIVEREAGKLAVVDYAEQRLLGEFSVTGNLRHASMVFDPALRFGYIISRDGVLSKISISKRRETDHLKISKNSIGLAVSQDGKTIATSNYQPGGITIIDAKSFKVIQQIPAKVTVNGKEIDSRVTGLVDAPGNRFICSLMDADEIWVIGPSEKTDSKKEFMVQRKIKAAAKNPFDALITPDGRYYIAGHFKQETASLIDLWMDSDRAKAVTLRRDSGKSRLPVKMPHMEGWAVAGGRIFIPVTSDKRLYSISMTDFEQNGHVDLIAEPVYAVVRPDLREIWISFSGDENDGKIQIVDLLTMKSTEVLNAGKRIYHLAFTPRGDRAIVSSNESNEVFIFDAMNHSELGRIPVPSPSGIFGIWRAFQTGL